MSKKFFLLSLLVGFCLVWGLWRDANRPYISYQKEFKKLLLKKGGGEKAGFQFGVRQRWIKELNRTDRCETCHLAVEDPRFKDTPNPFRFHPEADTHIFEKFGCTVCHGGQGMAVSVENAHGPAENWNRAVYHVDFMENSCFMCHGEYMKEQAPIISKGRAVFYEYGCRGCHKVKNKERELIGPPVKQLAQKVKADWLYRWIKKPQDYLPLAIMPDFKFSSGESAAIAHFMLPAADQYEEEESNGSAKRGKLLFNESRCVSCHAIEGRGGTAGPELEKVASKLHPGFIRDYLLDPHKFIPDTLMPRFGFGFTEMDATDISAFFVEEYFDLELEDEQVEQDLNLVKKAAVSEGKELIEKFGCTGCHEIESIEDQGEIGLELTTIGDIHISRLDFGEIDVAFEDRTVPNWLYNKMKNPRLFTQELKMPGYSFNDRESDAITTYLLSLKPDEVPESFRLVIGEPQTDFNPQGNFGKIVDKYRCFSCHKINGRGGEMAPDLSYEGSRIHNERSQESWLYKFMKTPYAIRPILVERMPRFKITDEEIESISTYFKHVLVDDRVYGLTDFVNSLALKGPKIVAAGKSLYYKKYACNACHQINLKGGTIGPDLTDAGKRLSTEWIFYYLRDPKAFLKPSREPVYDFTDKEIESLAAFLINPKEKQ